MHKYHARRRSSAKVDIEFAEVNKTVFANDDQQVDSSSYVILELKRGYWGYYITTKPSKFVKE
ncbi:hypothetical protein [Mucilaginibacter celer]|nr:hypothetical protein [Mucilaginibacter celer]